MKRVSAMTAPMMVQRTSVETLFDSWIGMLCPSGIREKLSLFIQIISIDLSPIKFIHLSPINSLSYQSILSLPR